MPKITQVINHGVDLIQVFLDLIGFRKLLLFWKREHIDITSLLVKA